MDRIIKALASGLGSGYAPIASGTFGTLVGMLVYLLLPTQSPGFYLLWVIGITAVGIPIATRAERLWGTPEKPSKDDGRIVIDEIAGYLVTMAFLPADRLWIILGFFAFRIADILKLPFGKRTEELEGGLGVMLDDVAAGAFACLALHLLHLIL